MRSPFSLSLLTGALIVLAVILAAAVVAGIFAVVWPTMHDPSADGAPFSLAAPLGISRPSAERARGVGLVASPVVAAAAAQRATGASSGANRSFASSPVSVGPATGPTAHLPSRSPRTSPFRTASPFTATNEPYAPGNSVTAVRGSATPSASPGPIVVLPPKATAPSTTVRVRVPPVDVQINGPSHDDSPIISVKASTPLVDDLPVSVPEVHVDTPVAIIDTDPDTGTIAVQVPPLGLGVGTPDPTPTTDTPAPPEG